MHYSMRESHAHFTSTVQLNRCPLWLRLTIQCPVCHSAFFDAPLRSLCTGSTVRVLAYRFVVVELYGYERERSSVRVQYCAMLPCVCRQFYLTQFEDRENLELTARLQYNLEKLGLIDPRV